MMNFLSIAASALWILGLALLLAALSWSYWVVQTERLRWGEILRRPGVRRILGIALALFCAGLAATEARIWARALWGVLAVLWIVQGWWPWKEKQ